MSKIKQIVTKIFKKNSLILSKKEQNILHNYPEYCYEYAKKLNFKNIPSKIIHGISKNWMFSYYFLVEVHKKTSISKYISLINSVARKSLYSSEFLLKFLNYKDVPESLINCAKNSRLIEKEEIRQCVLNYERKKKLEKLLA